MAKKTTTTVTETTAEEQAAAAAEPIGIIEEAPIDVELMRTVTALRGSDGGVIRIYRQGPGGIRDLEMLDEIGPDEFSPMMLAKPPYNGGKFRIHIQDAEGRMILNQVFRIAPSRESLLPHAGASAEMGALERMFMQMQANFERLFQTVAAKPVESPLTTLQGIKEIAEIVRPAAASQSSATELMATLKLMRELREFTGEGKAPFTDEGEIKPGVLINKAAEFFLTAMRGGQQAEAAALPAPTAQPQPVAQPQPAAQPAAQPQISEEDKEELMLFQLQLRAANRGAKNGDDPEEFADSVYSMLGEDMIRTIATDAQWFEKLCQFEPGCSEHKAWYEKVRASLIEFATADGILTVPAAGSSVGEPGSKTEKSTSETDAAAGNVPE